MLNKKQKQKLEADQTGPLEITKTRYFFNPVELNFSKTQSKTNPSE